MRPDGAPSQGRWRLQPVPFYGLVLLAGYAAYLVLAPFFVSLTWAVVFGIVFHRLHAWLARRAGPTQAALLTTLLVACLIVGPAVVLVSALAQQVPHVIDSVQQASLTTPRQVERLWEAVRRLSPVPLPEEPMQVVREGMLKGLALLAPRAGAVLANLVATIGSLFAMLFALFFMLRDGDTLARELRDRLPLSPVACDRLMRDTRDLVIASVGAGLAVAAAQGAVGGAAFWLLGVESPLFWSVVLGFSSLVPVVGAALIWVPAAMWLLMSGDVGRGVVMLLVGTFGISLTDNILRPLLLSGRASVSGLVIFFGLLGGAAAFGFVGLVIGPIILVVTGSLLRTFTDPDLNDERERRADSGQPAA